jgi:adenosine deaminase
MLHDHLDGGLRPATIIEIAEKIGYKKLPSSDPIELGKWFEESCNSHSLVRYLETFSHTIAVMQTQEAIIQVARECAIDLARDGVVYAEVRGAPELFTEQGLSIDQVVEATTEGYKQGMAEAAKEGKIIRVESLLCGMRQAGRSQEAAEAVVKYRDKGVVGFDIAGPEDGFPPTKQLETFEYLRRENAHFTIHAGEAYGLPSIWEAIQICGAERLGHGVRIIDDIDFSGATPKLGRLSSYVRDRRIPLELCPTSNLQTGAVKTYKDHPIGVLAKLRFRITLNTDNRLMSNTSMSHEMTECVKAFDWKFVDLQRVTVNALKSSFIPFEERLEIIEKVVKPAYLAIAAE